MTVGHDVTSAEADVFVRLARVWSDRGKSERAIALYDQALAARPGFQEAFVEVVDLLEATEDWHGIAGRCETWIAEKPDHAAHGHTNRVHNLRIDALCRIGGIELAFDVHGLTQITPGTVELADDDVILIVVVRNEALRLPAFLEHHRRLGIDRFLVVDNGSDDDTGDLLAEQPDTIVWRTVQSFRASNTGSAWANLLLRRHVTTQWCLIVDADELFVYPGYEQRRIDDLCADLDREGATCYKALTLDMYGDAPLSTFEYRAGDDLLDACPYFDRSYYHMRIPFDGPRRNMTNYWGGLRARAFGGPLGGYLLNKVPLFRYLPGEVLMSGQHWLDRPTAEIGSGRGALLHFKFLMGFRETVRNEIERDNAATGMVAWQQYARVVDGEPGLVLHDPLYSVRYEGSDQLVRVGVMREGPASVRQPVVADTVLVPPIPPAAGVSRPFWSIVLVLDRDATTAGVADVLERLDPEASAELRVVVPAGAPELARSLEGLARGGPSTEMVIQRSTRFLGPVELRNLGLQQTRGSWVHVIGTNDVPPSAFYREIRNVLGSHPDATIAVGGVEGDECAALDFTISPAAFVAHRDLYESVGGFCATAGSAAAWEMLQRLVAAAPTDPVFVARSKTTCTTTPVTLESEVPTVGYGGEVVEWLAAIDLAEAAGMARSRADELRDRCARRAAGLVRREIEDGRLESALATLGEALRSAVTDDARQQLIAAVTGIAQ